MKKLLFVLVTTLGASAMAATTTKLPKDAMGLSTIEGIKLVEVSTPQPSHDLPPGVIVEAVSVATISIPLNGCADVLGPVSTKIERTNEGKTVIYISAINISRKASMLVRCIAQPVKTITIPLGLGFMSADDVELKVVR